MKNNFNEKNNEIDRKLSRLLRDHVGLKLTKIEPKSYQELLNYTVEIEIKNTELDRKIENYKFEIFRLTQNSIDLKLKLEEMEIKFKNFIEKIKLKDKSLGIYSTNDANGELKNLYKNNTNRSDNISVSSFSDDASIDKDLLNIKNYKFRDINSDRNINRLANENASLIDDLNNLVEELKFMRTQIEEKDNLISMLYQELDSLKGSIENNNIKTLEKDQNSSVNDQNELTENNLDKFSSPALKKNKQSPSHFTFNKLAKSLNDRSSSNRENISDNFILKSNHLENLEFIRMTLIEFLKNFGINEDFSKLGSSHNQIQIHKNNLDLESNKNINRNNLDTSIDYQADIKMKEIKYILVNLKKINIIFKTLFLEFSKNILNIFQNEFLSNINKKFEKMQNKFNFLSICLNKFINYIKFK